MKIPIEQLHESEAYRQFDAELQAEFEAMQDAQTFEAYLKEQFEIMQKESGKA